MRVLEIKKGKVFRNDFIGTDLTLDLKFINNKTGEELKSPRAPLNTSDLPG